MGWFLGLGIAGLVLLVLSLVFDGLLEGVFDGLSGGLDGFRSLPVIAGFLSMLGFAGAITLGATGLGMGAATGVGVLAGAGAGWLTWKFSRALMSDADSDAPRGEDLVGSSGTVVTGIPADGYGEVLVYLGGQPTKFAANGIGPAPATSKATGSIAGDPPARTKARSSPAVSSVTMRVGQELGKPSAVRKSRAVPAGSGEDSPACSRSRRRCWACMIGPGRRHAPRSP